MRRLLLGVFTPFLLAVSVLAPARRTTPLPVVQRQAQREPLEYFQEMMPVFTHNRCMNCHGEVNPSTGDNHDGGVIDAGESCTASGCHSQANNTNHEEKDDWKIAPSQVWFVGKDAKALCDQIADRVMNFGTQDLMDHLQGDFQIDLAFEGRSGGANEGQPLPPPMPKDSFLVAAARWMDDGFAACDREGTIIHTESIASDETQRVSAEMMTRFEQTGERTVTIRFANGQYRAEVEVKGQTKITQTMRMGSPTGVCEAIITSTGDYQDAGPVGRGGELGNVSASAALDVVFQRDSYAITVTVGQEKHKQLDRYAVRDGCGVGLRPAPSETLEQVWPATRFVIRGKLSNPRDRSVLAGRTMRLVNSRVSPDEDPWLHDHYAAAAQDGSLHPVMVKTIWHIRHRP